MATKWKKDTDNVIGLDLAPYDIYGATGFTALIKGKDDFYASDAGLTFTEVELEVITPVSTTLATDAVIGDTSVSVADATGITQGMVISIGGEFGYVSSVSGNTLNLRRSVKIGASSGDAVTQTGKTGLYEGIANLATLGQNMIIISNPSIGLMNEVVKVEIVDNTLDDLSTTINSESVAINSKLDSLSSAVGAEGSVSGNVIV